MYKIDNMVEPFNNLKMAGYTVTLAAEVDYETTLEIHLCIDGKEFAEFVVDGSAAWGEFRRNIFLNTVVNRIWKDPATKFESAAVREYVEHHVINGDWFGYDPVSITQSERPLPETMVTITGDLNNHTVNIYTTLNTDEYNLLEADLRECMGGEFL